MLRTAGRAIGRAPRAGMEDRSSGQGMIAPIEFVTPDRTLMPNAFRFLHSLFLAIARLEDRLDAAGIPRVADPDKVEPL